MKLLDEIKAYCPYNEQEQRDQIEIIRWIECGQDILTRENSAAHLTASSWVVSPDRKQVLMIYHNIYDSWAWMGGHADGEIDLLAVAMREAQEESGLKTLKPVSGEIFSLEILTVDGHIKRGCYVSGHLHLNVTYLFEADPEQPLRIKPDENSGVAWFPIDEIPNRVSEPWMQKWIYSKLCQKMTHNSFT